MSPIKGLSERRRLPRLGKIHLGVPMEGREYPDATEYFVLPEGNLGEEIAKHFGEKPKELDIVFPVDDNEQVASQYYKRYGNGTGLACRGDGVKASQRAANGEFVEIECPCECIDNKTCRPILNLMFMIPQVNLGGVFQIDTSGSNSIVNVNSGLDMIRAVAGHIDMVPCRLILEPKETTYWDPKKKENRKTTIHMLNLSMATPERIKLLSGKMQEIRASIGMGIALPSPQQSALVEETHLYPASIQGDSQISGCRHDNQGETHVGVECNTDTGEVLEPEPDGFDEIPDALEDDIGNEGAKELRELAKDTIARVGYKSGIKKLESEIANKYGVKSFATLTVQQSEEVIAKLNAWQPAE